MSLLVCREIKACGNKKRDTKTVLREGWLPNREMRLHRIIERQHNHPMGKMARSGLSPSKQIPF